MLRPEAPRPTRYRMFVRSHPRDNARPYRRQRTRHRPRFVQDGRVFIRAALRSAWRLLSCRARSILDGGLHIRSQFVGRDGIAASGPRPDDFPESILD